MSNQIITNSADETRAIAASLVKNLHGINVIALHGELGSGKTTFVQGIAEGLGIRKRIISPTFIIVRTYKINIKYPFGPSSGRGQISNIKYLYHVDLYRLEGENQIHDLGLTEFMEDQNNLVVIEWAEKMGNLLPRKRIDLKFEHIDEDKRKISLYI